MKDMVVEIERASQQCVGQTVCDVWGYSEDAPNVCVAMEMEFDGFWDLMCDALGRANKASADVRALE